MAKRATLDSVVLAEVQEILDRYHAQQARSASRSGAPASSAA
jgi:hypothetical protein